MQSSSHIHQILMAHYNHTFVYKNQDVPNYIGTYERLVDFNSQQKKQDAYLKAVQDTNVNYLYRTNQANFSKIPGMPIAYWASENVDNIFKEYQNVSDIADVKKGSFTGDNNRFLRLWPEVSKENTTMGTLNRDCGINSGKKWFPYNKGGEFRKWFGNRNYLINWFNDAEELRETSKFGLRNPQYIFREGITWSSLSSGSPSFRYSEKGFIFDSKGPMIFSDNLYYLIGLLNTKLADYILNILSPTLDYNPTAIKNIPFAEPIDGTRKIERITKFLISISEVDYNSTEWSWNFKRHPLLLHIADDKQNEVDGKLQNAFSILKDEAQSRFDQLKSNEEELNKIFIDLYGLNDELTPEVEDKDVSVRLADEERDIKSFLSYFIGVVFGRYSLDVDGLAFAGGDWDSDKYRSFVPNKDNILMLNDEKYFDDSRDIINRLKEFLKVTFGEESLNTNLKYISLIVGKKADNPEDSIRRYFVEDFFKDHKKIYQKRPIYWEFSSGRNNGFKALMYLHRYGENELAMLRTDYLQPLQGRYESRLNQLNSLYEVETVAKEKKNIEKELKHVTKQLDEIRKYDQSIQHLANEKINLDLDDGVVVNYDKLQDGENILSKI